VLSGFAALLLPVYYPKLGPFPLERRERRELEAIEDRRDVFAQHLGFDPSVDAFNFISQAFKATPWATSVEESNSLVRSWTA
jgi:hypothetical protein